MRFKVDVLDVLVAMGTPVTRAAKRATATIPIVFGLVGDARTPRAHTVTSR
jgi:ABC-type uncharacterized transport system substrate-binding protein